MSLQRSVHLRGGQKGQGGQQAKDELKPQQGQANAVNDLVQAKPVQPFLEIFTHGCGGSIVTTHT